MSRKLFSCTWASSFLTINNWAGFQLLVKLKIANITNHVPSRQQHSYLVHLSNRPHRSAVSRLVYISFLQQSLTQKCVFTTQTGESCV